MGRPLDELLKLLDLEKIDVNLYRGLNPDQDRLRVFGGQVVAQALVAATRTVSEWGCHSLHAYFLRAGNPALPILYRVAQSRDGKSFASRRVVAVQDGKEIFHMLASFHKDEEGFSHQTAMPSVPDPEEIPNEESLRRDVMHKIPAAFREMFGRPWPIESRPINPPDMLDPKPCEASQNVWIRADGVLPDERDIHLCVLAYASDMSLLDSCFMPHGLSWFTDEMHTASLDHALWFHRPFRADDWLLYVQDSPSAFGSRGFNRGAIYDRKGSLVASVAQEGLARLIRRRGEKK